MRRTTPPRPVDVAAVFPELAGMARTATRLHPRPGTPTVHDSSVGGPLLWPADEDWPMCEQTHWSFRVRGLEDVRARRRILMAGGPRTAAEQAVVDREPVEHDPTRAPAEPWPLLPVAQLYARDIPDLPCPDGTDLLQVLWCPSTKIKSSSSAVYLRWRRSSEVTQVLEQPPEPVFVDHDGYVPIPCVLHPEQVVEYPASHDLPDETAKRIRLWGQRERLNYEWDLSVAPGWKVGGWSAPWTFRDPPEPGELCCDCGAPVEPLLTIDSSEWDGGSMSWRPIEDENISRSPSHPLPHEPTGVTVGRGYTLQIYRCTVSYEHLPIAEMQ
ncbi:hypothetical protein [Thermomonospora amylolytica]|uniref:hypothetical protein n=1 Tax=Thermomonospora amylolytica TaxID=1411117 RepID=UPI000E6D3EBA|nr:hypothetical protein [Thermomonospora amylolytica]